MSGFFVLSYEAVEVLIEDYIRTKHGFSESLYKVAVWRDEPNETFRVEVGPKDQS